MNRQTESRRELFNLTINLETELTHDSSHPISTIVSGQRDSSGHWERVEVQFANDEDEIVYERVYPNLPTYHDVRDDYGPVNA